MLVQNQSFTFTFTTGVLDAGTVTNVVTVSGQDDEGSTATATDTATLTVANVAPSLSIAKTAPASIVEGNFATYSFTITNTSTASTDPVTITQVSDDVLGDLTAAALAANGGNPIVLAPGASFSFTYTTLTALNVDVIPNTVTVNGRDDENTPATATDSHTLTITNATPTITVDKTGPSTVTEGSTATYNFAIQNTSTASTDPVTITSVSDDILGDLTDAANAAWIAQGHTGPIVLAPGTGFTFSYTTLTVLGAGRTSIRSPSPATTTRARQPALATITLCSFPTWIRSSRWTRPSRTSTKAPRRPMASPSPTPARSAPMSSRSPASSTIFSAT